MVQIQMNEATAGVLDTSSRESAVEFAEVVAVGEQVNSLKVGDKVFVKAWAIDIVTHNEKRFYFCDQTSNGILAKVR